MYAGERVEFLALQGLHLVPHGTELLPPCTRATTAVSVVVTNYRVLLQFLGLTRDKRTRHPISIPLMSILNVQKGSTSSEAHTLRQDTLASYAGVSAVGGGSASTSSTAAANYNNNNNNFGTSTSAHYLSSSPSGSISDYNNPYASPNPINPNTGAIDPSAFTGDAILWTDITTKQGQCYRLAVRTADVSVQFVASLFDKELASQAVKEQQALAMMRGSSGLGGGGGGVLSSTSSYSFSALANGGNSSSKAAASLAEQINSTAFAPVREMVSTLTTDLLTSSSSSSSSASSDDDDLNQAKTISSKEIKRKRRESKRTTATAVGAVLSSAIAAAGSAAPSFVDAQPAATVSDVVDASTLISEFIKAMDRASPRRFTDLFAFAHYAALRNAALTMTLEKGGHSCSSLQDGGQSKEKETDAGASSPSSETMNPKRMSPPCPCPSSQAYLNSADDNCSRRLRLLEQTLINHYAANPNDWQPPGMKGSVRLSIVGSLGLPSAADALLTGLGKSLPRVVTQNNSLQIQLNGCGEGSSGVDGGDETPVVNKQGPSFSSSTDRVLPLPQQFAKDLAKCHDSAWGAFNVLRSLYRMTVADVPRAAEEGVGLSTNLLQWFHVFELVGGRSLSAAVETASSLPSICSPLSPAEFETSTAAARITTNTNTSDSPSRAAPRRCSYIESQAAEARRMALELSLTTDAERRLLGDVVHDAEITRRSCLALRDILHAAKGKKATKSESGGNGVTSSPLSQRGHPAAGDAEEEYPILCGHNNRTSKRIENPPQTGGTGVGSYVPIVSHPQMAVANANDLRATFSTYPTAIILPKRASNLDTITACARYRQNGRIPSISWIHIDTGACLSRSSQPRVGGGRNSRDDQLVLSYMNQALHAEVAATQHYKELAEKRQILVLNSQRDAEERGRHEASISSQDATKAAEQQASASSQRVSGIRPPPPSLVGGGGGGAARTSTAPPPSLFGGSDASPSRGSNSSSNTSSSPFVAGAVVGGGEGGGGGSAVGGYSHTTRTAVSGVGPSHVVTTVSLEKQKQGGHQSSGSAAVGARIIVEDRVLHILDCRSVAAATTNMAAGGGYELVQNYQRAKIHFMNLDNIHGVRRAFERLTRLVQQTQCGDSAAMPRSLRQRIATSTGNLTMLDSTSSSNDNSSAGAAFWSRLEATDWPMLVQRLLWAATKCCGYLQKGDSVLVHCTDGWDRTSQVVTLSMIMLDSHYRTVEGFCELIQREWLEYGHRFADRCGHQRRGAADEDGIASVLLSDTATLINKYTLMAAAERRHLRDVKQARTQPTAERKEKQREELGKEVEQKQEHTHKRRQTEKSSGPTKRERFEALGTQQPPPLIRSVSDGRFQTKGSSSAVGPRVSGKEHEQTSPVFIQFFDAVYQLLRMFPNQFEFTPNFLSYLLEEAYGCRFGTFLLSCHRDRVQEHAISARAYEKVKQTLHNERLQKALKRRAAAEQLRAAEAEAKAKARREREEAGGDVLGDLSEYNCEDSAAALTTVDSPPVHSKTSAGAPQQKKPSNTVASAQNSKSAFDLVNSLSNFDASSGALLSGSVNSKSSVGLPSFDDVPSCCLRDGKYAALATTTASVWGEIEELILRERLFPHLVPESDRMLNILYDPAQHIPFADSTCAGDEEKEDDGKNATTTLKRNVGPAPHTATPLIPSIQPRNYYFWNSLYARPHAHFTDFWYALSVLDAGYGPMGYSVFSAVGANAVNPFSMGIGGGGNGGGGSGEMISSGLVRAPSAFSFGSFGCGGDPDSVSAIISMFLSSSKLGGIFRTEGEQWLMRLNDLRERRSVANAVAQQKGTNASVNSLQLLPTPAPHLLGFLFHMFRHRAHVLQMLLPTAAVAGVHPDSTLAQAAKRLQLENQRKARLAEEKRQKNESSSLLCPPTEAHKRKSSSSLTNATRSTLGRFLGSSSANPPEASPALDGAVTDKTFARSIFDAVRGGGGATASKSSAAALAISRSSVYVSDAAASTLVAGNEQRGAKTNSPNSTKPAPTPSGVTSTTHFATASHRSRSADDATSKGSVPSSLSFFSSSSLAGSRRAHQESGVYASPARRTDGLGLDTPPAATTSEKATTASGGGGREGNEPSTPPDYLSTSGAHLTNSHTPEVFRRRDAGLNPNDENDEAKESHEVSKLGGKNAITSSSYSSPAGRRTHSANAAADYLKNPQLSPLFNNNEKRRKAGDCASTKTKKGTIRKGTTNMREQSSDDNDDADDVIVAHGNAVTFGSERDHNNKNHLSASGRNVSRSRKAAKGQLLSSDDDDEERRRNGAALTSSFGGINGDEGGRGEEEVDSDNPPQSDQEGEGDDNDNSQLIGVIDDSPFEENPYTNNNNASDVQTTRSRSLQQAPLNTIVDTEAAEEDDGNGDGDSDEGVRTQARIDTDVRSSRRIPRPAAAQLLYNTRRANTNNGSHSIEDENSMRPYGNRNGGQTKLDFIPRSLASHCELCFVVFTFFNRRHCCRRCCRAACDKCSAHAVVLSPSEIGLYEDRSAVRTPLRVCAECYREHRSRARFAAAAASSSVAAGGMRGAGGEYEDEGEHHYANRGNSNNFMAGTSPNRRARHDDED